MGEKQFAPGTSVWVIERDEDDEPCDVSGYVFLAGVGDYVILSPYIYGVEDIEYLMEGYRRDTCGGFDASLQVFFEEDCFATQAEAREAFVAEGGDKDG